MNNPSPLVPQGSLQDQKNQGRARVKIAVFVVLAVHGIGLLALLMQGCKKEPETATPNPDLTASNAAPAFAETTNPPPVDTNPPGAVAPPTAPAVAAPPATVTDYKILAGDTLSTIARKFHITLRALTDSNPGIEPTKLQIGQTIKIPAPAVSSAPAGGMASAATDTSSGEQVYVVKSGDTLIKIAADHKTTVKALRSANSLTTDKIKVGQKLKIPAGASAPATAASPSEPAPVLSATSAPAASPK
jgi:LysM repeat protein